VVFNKSETKKRYRNGVEIKPSDQNKSTAINDSAMEEKLDLSDEKLLDDDDE